MTSRPSWLPHFRLLRVKDKSELADIDGRFVNRVREYIERFRLFFPDQPHNYVSAQALGLEDEDNPTFRAVNKRPHREVEELTSLFNHYQHEVNQLKRDVEYEQDRAATMADMITFLYAGYHSVVVEQNPDKAVAWCNENATNGRWKNFPFNGSDVFIFESPDDAALFMVFNKAK